ncbi:allantoate permease [Microdochium trichocladiopsis]|uniref:Allantoate permease n=1 Tax=Microdochium trichocladiopsis TaxID=1682393 RepID=A0A9P9BLU7_9PEZI|nr:allantoate permease [Microdochium trichocladiopsis]KAH7024790.1 allantoate permease [Microdochium trichocladiopsis]
MDSKPAKLTTTDDDVSVNNALVLLHAGAEEDIDEGARRRLVSKLDWRLMPILCITYALQSIDRTTLSYAAVFGVREDLHLTSTEFSWAGALLYIGYLFWEFPTNVLLQKLPINHFMAATVIIWGAVLMCHGAAINFAGLAAARTFLGAFEASINPGTMLLFSMYYERKEQPLRMGIWVGSAGVGYIVAGIVSFGIGHVQGSMASWRILFLFWGAVTVAWGVVVVLFLPGSPLTTKFLSDQERIMVVSRAKTNGTGIDNKRFKWKQFGEAMMDLKTWLLFVFAVSSNTPNGGLTVFQGLIIQGMGFSKLQTTLIQMPSGAVQLVACVTACYCASRFAHARLIIMILCLMPFLAGILGLWLIDSAHPYGRLACLWISFAYTATWTLSMSVATANTAGHTKKITTNAMLLIGYCLGNFVGPFFFRAEQAPRYPLGVGMMLVCVGLQILCLLGLLFLLWSRNKSRKEFHVPTAENDHQVYERGLSDETDLENKYFKVSALLQHAQSLSMQRSTYYRPSPLRRC